MYIDAKRPISPDVTISDESECSAHRCVSQPRARESWMKKHTCTNQDVQPHYEVSVKKKKERAVYPPETFQHRISQVHMEPR